MRSTSMPPVRRSDIDWIACAPPELRESFLNELSEGALLALPYLFEVWALAHQLPPAGNWRTWVVMGGRGAGKTRAGAEWVRAMVEGPTPLAAGACRRVALIAETLDQAREVMIEGESGLRACSPPDRAPRWEMTRRRLVWPNGAEARAFSAFDPEALRGPQFDAAWCDELAKWRKGRAAWDQLQFALRLGERPRQIVTTTPRRNPLLVEILEAADTVAVSAPTEANRSNLAPGFIEAVEARFKGTALARQELMGELLMDEPGALWRRDMIDAGRAPEAPSLARVVVAVDPPATSGPAADACGIVVAGVTGGERPVAWVLQDATVQGLSPGAWAERAVAVYHAWRADRLVAEVNQGGEMVGTLVRQADETVAYRPVRATRGKAVRAEPVAALYEQGRVRHAGVFPDLEDQMCAFTGDRSGGASPDRVDALVWAISELMLSGARDPRVRGL